MLIWLRQDTEPVALEHGVLRAADVLSLQAVESARHEAAQRAGAHLARAQAEADALLADARGQAMRLLQAARLQVDEACQQGYEDGLQRAAVEWHERQAAHAQNTVQALRSLHDRLAGIVTMAVERIVHVEDRGALFRRALHSVQALSRGALTLTLRVSPGDEAAARGGLAELPPAVGDAPPLELAVDSSLQPGSCVFESDLGVLDASLHTQLDGLRLAMERAVRRALAEEQDAGPGAPQDTDDPEGGFA